MFLIGSTGVVFTEKDLFYSITSPDAVYRVDWSGLH